ncbi:MAG: FHA domain-containing protein [Planctomycetia bacterium]|nr:FHA domain-containing protein [Planctomycetia bacterium]
MYGMLKPKTAGDDIILEETELVIGRNSACDIVLRFPNVSSRHCKLVLSDGYWYILDLRSTNGTRLNGMPVTDHRVDPGMRVMFADHEYRLEYDPMANGNAGVVPPDFYETDVFSRSLLESAGIASSSRAPRRYDPTSLDLGRDGLQEVEKGIYKTDYSDLTLDDIEFE